ncbi:TatD family hydrolase [Butyrivibrio sp. AE2032]|uniref:TatD family hydrolase n=1 Tax=Butyrivibrio sp. AE2032 TaxID=1458463 RepID=UPI00068CEDB6|nr:TatD family hydrolase [Butyrivibrio sp. AE2032]
MKEAVYYSGSAEFFDTHAHIYSNRYEKEGNTSVEDVLQRCRASGVTSVLIPADNEYTSKASVDLANRLDGFSGVTLYASVGVHPHEAKDYTDDTEKFLRDCLEHRSEKKIMALGEIGLDYYYDHSERNIQREVFEKQLILAYEYDIPFILHERDATGDCLDILRRFYKEGRLRSLPGVCHCCSCSLEASQELVKMGFYLGFDGPITFKNNKKTPEVALNTPWDRIVIETDSPYLTPEPNRGLLNEPCHVPFVCEKIAEIKGVTIDEAARITYDNGKKLYGVD